MRAFEALRTAKEWVHRSSLHSRPPATVIAPNDLALAVYRGILGREPQASELSALATGIAQHSSELGLSAILDSVVRSEEASQRLRTALASPTLDWLQDQVSREAVTIVSVGAHCLAANFLRTMGLRRASYPFDWLFSNLGIVQQCLDTDFADFLDPTHYEPVPLAARRAPNEGYTHHRLYREHFGGPPVFNHHDMTKPEAQAHFARAVERFRALRRRPTPAIYLGVSHAGAPDLARAAALSRALCRSNLDTLVLVEVDERPIAHVGDISPCTVEAQGNLMRITFRPGSRMGGLTFGNLEDDDLLRAILARTFAQVIAQTGSKSL